jgi:uncharacterized ubiquitin-like protein YukD
MSEEIIGIKIKLSSNSETFELSISKSATIKDLKEICKSSCEINPEEQTLVYRGKILMDGKLIRDYNIENEHTLILVKKYTAPKGKVLFFI